MFGGDGMGICPNCGEWVDDGDVCMNCVGSSGGNAGWDDPTLTYHTGKDLPGRFERDRIRVNNAKRFYEMGLERAREVLDTRNRIKVYNRALDYYDEYLRLSQECQIEIEGMPGPGHALPDEDMEWLREKHLKSKRKFTLFGNDELEAIEKLLERLANI